MCDFYGFLNWCTLNNSGFIQFNNTKGNRKLFGDFIIHCAQNKNLFKTIHCIETTMTLCKTHKDVKLFLRTMRMSLIDQMCY